MLRRSLAVLLGLLAACGNDGTLAGSDAGGPLEAGTPEAVTDGGRSPIDASGPADATADGNSDAAPPPLAPGLNLLAGKLGGLGTTDGTGPDARFGDQVEGAWFDGAGTLYVADADHTVDVGATIRSIDVATGEVRTLAGSIVVAGEGLDGCADGVGASAQFSWPRGVTGDGTGLLYVADASCHTIRQISIASGAVTTIAGTAGRAGSVDGAGTGATFTGPDGVTLDGAGGLLVADDTSIRRIDLATGVVSTVPGTRGAVRSAHAVAYDGAGHLYVAEEFDDAIRVIGLATGENEVLAGVEDADGTSDGVGTAARLDQPAGLALDGAGNLFFTENMSGMVREIQLATGEVTTVAGGNGWIAEGVGRAAGFLYPTGIAYGTSVLYVTEQGRVRRMALGDDSVSTLAGPEFVPDGSADGRGASAQLQVPRGVAVDEGDVYVTDQINHTIRRWEAATGTLTTFAGTPGESGTVDGRGGAARFGETYGIAADGRGSLFVSDTTDDVIRRIAVATADVTTLAGSSTASGDVDGVGSSARFGNPLGLASDGADTLYVVDQGGSALRAITVSTGRVSTLTLVDGAGAPVAYSFLDGLVVDGGVLYATDDDKVFAIDPATGTTRVLAGGTEGSANGAGAAAQLAFASGLATDGHGTLYVADAGNAAVRRIVVATGEVTTVVGTPGRRGVQLGPLPARLNGPAGVALMPSGDLVIADAAENALLLARW